jgi:hypothetical protein
MADFVSHSLILRPTAIYHITHIDNLLSILGDGGLRCCGDLRRANVPTSRIAEP